MLKFENLNLVVEFDGATHRIPVKIYGGQETTDRQKYNDSIKYAIVEDNMNDNYIRLVQK